MIVLPAPGSSASRKRKRLAREHLLVDGRDLVRQGVDERRVDGEERIEEVGEVDAVGLRDQPEESAVGVEAPGRAGRGDFERRLTVPVEELVPEPALGVLVRGLEDAAVPLDAHDRNESVGQDALNRGAGLEVFETSHVLDRVVFCPAWPDRQCANFARPEPERFF